ncbi:paired amphipathic helix protein Sin3-like 3 [Populus nigra]|uniref:paired amphipathic helix protein Sin3-like 3 n=1 Tax=Populus nigra TaxID=3691 RepID=UPI002B2660A6|nr:paired amphipathic helix protein Sin3-like 3 [Populus nigra]
MKRQREHSDHYRSLLSQYPREEVEPALNYSKKLKAWFQYDQPEEKIRSLGRILEKFMDTAAAHDGLVGGLTVVFENFSERVKEILGGNHDLIGGLNSFLRPEFQISLDVEEKKETEPAMESKTVGDGERMDLRLRKEGSMSLADVCNFGHRVTEGHPDLLLDFLYSMPITEATPLADYLPGLKSSELRNCRVDELQKESPESFEVCGKNRESEFVKAGGSQVKGGSHDNEEEKETETTTESKTFRRVMDFINKLKIKCGEDGLEKFLKIFKLLKKGSRTLVDVFDSGLKLTEGHGDLQEDFIKFMPLSELEKPLAYHLSDLLSTDLTNTRVADVPQKKRQNDKEAKLIMEDEAEVKASDSEAEKIREGIGFFEKVKKRLPCEMRNYPDLMSDFYNFWRNCESVNVLEVRGCKARDRRRQRQSREELDFSSCKRSTPRRSLPNHHERNVFKCEDEQYELDMLVEWFKSAVIYAEEMGGGTVKNKENKMSGRIFLRCIERLYGDEGLEILDIFDKDPQRALPVLRLRLQKKLEELIRYRQSFEMHHG